MITPKLTEASKKLQIEGINTYHRKFTPNKYLLKGQKEKSILSASQWKIFWVADVFVCCPMILIYFLSPTRKIILQSARKGQVSLDVGVCVRIPSQVIFLLRQLQTFVLTAVISQAEVTLSMSWCRKPLFAFYFKRQKQRDVVYLTRNPGLLLHEIAVAIWHKGCAACCITTLRHSRCHITLQQVQKKELEFEAKQICFQTPALIVFAWTAKESLLCHFFPFVSHSQSVPLLSMQKTGLNCKFLQLHTDQIMTTPQKP